MLFHYFREGFLAPIPHPYWKGSCNISSSYSDGSLCPELGNQFLEVKIFFELLFPVSETINTFSLDLPRVSSIYSDYTVKSQYVQLQWFFPALLVEFTSLPVCRFVLGALLFCLCLFCLTLCFTRLWLLVYPKGLKKWRKMATELEVSFIEHMYLLTYFHTI